MSRRPKRLGRLEAVQASGSDKPMRQVTRIGNSILETSTEEGEGTGPVVLVDGETMQLGGNKMVLTDNPDGSVSLKFDDKGTGRSCGGCTLCCKLLPVPIIEKKAGERCKAQRSGKGCAIYDRRPGPCRLYFCRWLSDPTTTNIPRPDRAHYVIDFEWDNVVMTPHDPSEPAKAVSVIQIWVDPAFPDAWDTPELRRYINSIAERFGAGTIIRLNERDAFTVWAPCLTHDHQWHTHRSGVVVEKAQLEAKVDQIREAEK